MRNIESKEQQAVVQWAGILSRRHPELGLLLAIPNGGKRTKITASILRAEGVRAGVPDLLLPAKRGDAGGLWIEMKSKSGTVKPHQRKWLDDLTAAGYATAVCFGFDEARKVICDYLGISE